MEPNLPSFMFWSNAMPFSLGKLQMGTTGSWENSGKSHICVDSSQKKRIVKCLRATDSFRNFLHMWLYKKLLL